MPKQYLAEGLKGAFPFIVDRTVKPVTESRPNGGVVHRIPGRFSVCDCINGNNRRYSKRVWEKNLTEGSVLQEAIKKNAAFGLLEHPKDGQVTLESPISHQVVSAQLIESKDASGKTVYEVIGEIALYNPNLVPESAKLLGLIEGGYNPLVSSRGYGTLEKAPDGVDDVAEDYVCEGWDVVIKPSFANAELIPNRQPLSTDAAKMAATYTPNPTAESVSQPAKVTPLKESLPSSGASSPSARSSNVITTKPMEIQDIKAQISVLESRGPKKLSAFAESMAQVEKLHQDIAVWAAEDPKRSYEAQKLHQKLDSVAESHTNTARAPIQEARRLTEQNHKLLTVVNAVAKTALGYKKKLGESAKTGTSSKRIAEELTRRGQGWQRLAESRKQKLTSLEREFNTACEALDIMAARYHEDVTELGRKVLTLEFKDKLDPALQKSLKEATRLRHIAAIRETIEKKGLIKPEEGKAPGKENVTPKKQKDAASPNSNEVAGKPGAVANESRSPIGENTVLTEATIVTTGRGDLSETDESVNLVRRLSESAK